LGYVPADGRGPQVLICRFTGACGAVGEVRGVVSNCLSRGSRNASLACVCVVCVCVCVWMVVRPLARPDGNSAEPPPFPTPDRRPGFLPLCRGPRTESAELRRGGGEEGETQTRLPRSSWRAEQQVPVEHRTGPNYRLFTCPTRTITRGTCSRRTTTCSPFSSSSFSLSYKPPSIEGRGYRRWKIRPAKSQRKGEKEGEKKRPTAGLTPELPSPRRTVLVPLRCGAVRSRSDTTPQPYGLLLCWTNGGRVRCDACNHAQRAKRRDGTKGQFSLSTISAGSQSSRFPLYSWPHCLVTRRPSRRFFVSVNWG